MSFEMQSPEPSEFGRLSQAAREKPEDFSGEDAARLVLADPSGSEFEEILQGVWRATGKKFSLVFDMDDFGDCDEEKINRLRQIRELCGSDFRDFVDSVLVRGNVGENELAPNVFLSGVRFEVKS
jgi:hypothetical protein